MLNLLKRLSIVLLLSGGCTAIGHPGWDETIARHVIAVDVADGVLLGGAIACTAECHGAAKDASIGVLVVEPVVVAYLALITIISLWGHQ